MPSKLRNKGDSLFTLVICAAGKAERLGSSGKALLKIEGKSLIEHNLETCLALSQLECVIIAAREADIDAIERAVVSYRKSLDIKIVIGGSTRQDSVYRALAAIAGSPKNEKALLTMVHDVARPLFRADLAERLIEGMDGLAGVVPVIPVTDTLKRVENKIVCETLDRNSIFAVQTPQLFSTDVLIESHRKARERSFEGTDDASLLESAGHRIGIVEGDICNIKITYKEDIEKAVIFLKRLTETAEGTC